ncbi:MAG: hypothetical protein AB7T38_15250 [Nitrospirales bacterium]
MMMEFGVGNPLIELIFGIISLVGVSLLGVSNLMLEPPKSSVKADPRTHGWLYRNGC